MIPQNDEDDYDGSFWEDPEMITPYPYLQEGAESKKQWIDQLNQASQELPADYYYNF